LSDARFPFLSTPRASAAAGAVSWQRWEMSSLAQPRARVRDVAAAQPLPAAAPAFDAAELQRLREQAVAAATEQGRAQGLADGHAQGYDAGLAAGRAEIESQAAHWLALARSLPEALRLADAQMAQHVVALAMDVARQVVDRTYRDEPQWLVPLVRQLLREHPALQGEPRLSLHPGDLELVRDALGTELQAAGWQLCADAALARGGCTVQAGNATHDATIETRWARVCAAVTAE
jgi:flagellar assembly protein FliH